jgi:hypothetical protein
MAILLVNALPLDVSSLNLYQEIGLGCIEIRNWASAEFNLNHFQQE